MYLYIIYIYTYIYIYIYMCIYICIYTYEYMYLYKNALWEFLERAGMGLSARGVLQSAPAVCITCSPHRSMLMCYRDPTPKLPTSSASVAPAFEYKAYTGRY